MFPLLTVAAGVMLTVFVYAWLKGTEASVLETTAHFETGDLRVATKAYAADADQIPNDLALLGADSVVAGLRHSYPGLHWTPRIRFGGLLDIPDTHGETRVQAPVMGMGVDLLSPETPEWDVLRIRSAVVRGRVPARHGEIVISDGLASRLGIPLGQTATLIGVTMYGSMALANFTVVGTVRFGVGPMDHGAVIADISDVRAALDMANGAGEILGFFPDGLYHAARADSIADQFNLRHRSTDPFAPIMGTLRRDSGLSDILDYMTTALDTLIALFILAMSVVLWNAGLMGSLRRYGEIGVRLALGEDRGHIYGAMILESLLVGLAGSVCGTAVGLLGAGALAVHGIDVGRFMKGSAMMMGDVVRAQVTLAGALVGFVPGLLATLLGTGISGIGIYRRDTSQLFKELDA